jgi:hypothetical protein
MQSPLGEVAGRWSTEDLPEKRSSRRDGDTFAVAARSATVHRRSGARRPRRPPSTTPTRRLGARTRVASGANVRGLRGTIPGFGANSDAHHYQNDAPSAHPCGRIRPGPSHHPGMDSGRAPESGRRPQQQPYPKAEARKRTGIQGATNSAGGSELRDPASSEPGRGFAGPTGPGESPRRARPVPPDRRYPSFEWLQPLRLTPRSLRDHEPKRSPARKADQWASTGVHRARLAVALPAARLARRLVG